MATPTVGFSLRMPPELYEQFLQAAEERGLKPSEAMRAAVAQWIFEEIQAKKAS